ncbi:LPXTG-site transpeptidase (sortase) family protein [Parafannyhessea umbonata]|uniref:LPXTG-site transpeptidase (Sortase) family protein n=2 Tax=Parafannyhessea umbonata TaxID=604330 RepID=A0A1G6M481_9ACTN|nr:LPXTG-site transpeptidase (sortase) family protein [Parafannyhessea umbonata]
MGTAGWTATVVSCWGAMAEYLAADGKAKGHKGRGRRHKRLPRWADRLITVLIILVGAGLPVWSWVADRLEASGVFNQITTVSGNIDAMSKEERARYLSQARAYNAVLAGQTPKIPADQILPYAQQLTFDRDPMMSWIEIPSINVSMPIYHGTSESALMAGVGHLEGTSLPVGGKSTHCVLTAHSGMRNLSMFDDIRDLLACETRRLDGESVEYSTELASSTRQNMGKRVEYSMERSGMVCLRARRG